MTIWFEESIPLDKLQLTGILRSTIPTEDWTTFSHFSQLLESFCDSEFQKILNQLQEYYQPFNPNSNIVTALDEISELQYAQHLMERFRRFLEQAQYQPIAEADIRDIIRQTRVDGIKLVLPPERYREFLLYYREREVTTIHRRSWHYLWLKRSSKVITSYKRLTLFFRPFRRNFTSNPKRTTSIQDSNITNDWQHALRAQPITLKLFQNIREDSLPIILPGITIKTSMSSKLFLLSLLMLSMLVAIVFSWLCDSCWYALLGLFPLGWALYAIILAEARHRAYYRNLLVQLYHKNVSNNSGVLRYLLDRISEETYKQNLLVIYALWKRQEWAYRDIGLKDINQYLRKFLLEYFGLNVTLDLENIIPNLMTSQNANNDYPGAIALLTPVSQTRIYLRQGFPEAGDYLDTEDSTPPLPRMGMAVLAPGTEQAEDITFERNEFWLTNNNPQGFEFSHPQGSAVRWILEKPIRIALAQDCKMDSDTLVVSPNDAVGLPLQGIGKIVLDEKNDKFIEFRFHRSCKDNHLSLDGGLRYRHRPTYEYPILVRPVLPRWVLSIEIPAGQDKIPIPYDIVLPQQGLLKIEALEKSQIIPYQIETTGMLKLLQPTSEKLQLGTTISLTPPTTQLEASAQAGAVRLPIIHNQYFGGRGHLIVDANTESEERVMFRGEIWEIELDKTLEFNHRRRGLVILHEQLKSDIANHVTRGHRRMFIQGVASAISQGKIIIDPGEHYQETCSFKIMRKYFDLVKPTQYFHDKDTEICQAYLESSLKYEALQGSHLITVEDASQFPLAGILEIHYNGTSGAKEVFPYVRTEGSNTLRLQTQIKQFIHQNTPILITAVEVTTNQAYQYHEHGCDVDFSCVPDFPQQGQIVIEPGSQNEEKIHFTRHPQRMRLSKPLKYYHPTGTVVDLNHYASCVLSESWQTQQTRIVLEYQHLLPQHGSLIIQVPGQAAQVIWYRKKANCLLLMQPCRFHHTQSTCVTFPVIPSNVRLTVGVEKGAKQLQVEGEQDLPIKGKLIIEGFLHTITVQFFREGNILYLESPLEYSFSKHVRINLPEMYINNHASPGQDYLEVVDASFAPKEGELLIKPGSQFQERISFQYRPEILWLDKPLEKTYPAGTVVYSPELWAKGAANLEISNMEKIRDSLQQILLSQHLQPNQTITNRPPTFQSLHNITQNFLRQIPRPNDPEI